MTDIQACKAIFAYAIRSEIFKQRNPDKEKNKEIIDILGNAYTAIEIELQKMLKQLEQGVPIEVILSKKIEP